MNEFYQEWIDSSLFAIEEAMGMAIEFGHSDDVAQLERAHDALASVGVTGTRVQRPGIPTFTLTDKGHAYLTRQRSIKRGREAKRAYDRAYSMVRADKPAYMQMEINDWPIVDAAHQCYKNTFKDDELANVQRRLMAAYLERGMMSLYRRARTNFYDIKRMATYE